MNGRAELIERIAERRARELGGLTEKGYAELRLAIDREPEAFINTSDEHDLWELIGLLDTYTADLSADEFLDDRAFFEHYRARMEQLCERSLDIYERNHHILDAYTISCLASAADTEEVLDELMAAEDRLVRASGPLRIAESGDSWEAVENRPRLRLAAAIARLLADTSCYQLACERCSELIELAPADELGARRTWALALARLEREDDFNALELCFSQQGDAWFFLAHTLLLFKLDRLDAARRSLTGYSELIRGGAYALLRPTFVDPYLPDRPVFEPRSFDEARAAVSEADPIICDTPDFIGWAEKQPGIEEAARSFASSEGFDF